MLFFLFISSIIFFKSGLTRSDGPHIKYTSGIYTLLIYFFISYYLINIINISKFRFILNFFLKKKYLNILIFIIYFTFFFKNNFSNILNIFNPNKNFYRLTKLDDEKFLNKIILILLKYIKI
jgi:hypothetical protein